MQIKEVLKMTASMLGRNEVIDFLDGKTQNVGEDTLMFINNMASLANIVINELACSYIPMIKCEEIESLNGKISYSDLTEKVIRIKDVYSLDGRSISYSQTAEHIIVNEKNVMIEYQYSPANYGIDDDIGYSERDISARVIAYGLLAEIALSEGRFNVAISYHKRYVDSIAELCLPKNANIKKRSWI